MTTPLYDLTARNYIQFMTAALGCLEKAKAHYTNQGKDYHQLVSKSYTRICYLYIFRLLQ